MNWRVGSKILHGGGYILILKQNGSKVESTKDSKHTFFGNVEGDYLNGWITLPNRRPVFLKMSPDNRSFSGNFKDFGLTVYSSIWGKRRR